MPVKFDKIKEDFGTGGHAVRKEILLLDEPGGELTPLKEAMEILAFNVTTVHSQEAAFALLKGGPAFALLGVYGPQCSEDMVEKLLQAVVEKDVSTPVVWLSKSSVDEQNFDTDLNVEQVQMPCSKSALEAQAMRLLNKRFFPEPIGAMLSDAGTSTTQDFFGTESRAIDTFLKSDALSLAPISAMITFVGAGCQGCLSVSGDSSVFQKFHETILPNSPAPPAQSIAGEVCNLMTGAFKTSLAQFGFDLKHSFPVLVYAHPISLSYGGPGRLSLVSTLETTFGELYVELCLDVFNGEVLKQESDPIVTMDQGEINFF